MKLSIIIPIGFKESNLKCLLEDLKSLPKNTEVLLLTSNMDNIKDIEKEKFNLNIKKILSPLGRANSMNLGSEGSSGEFLWFLHADSRLDKDTIYSLFKVIEEQSKDLLYFNLSFYDGPKLIKLNELGVRFRTYFLKTPFGDQGFCIRRDIFKQLGSYKEGLPYGEDHILVREAKRKNIKITRIKSKIYTSGRKYENNGWLKTTLTHLYLWQLQIYKDYKKHRRKNI